MRSIAIAICISITTIIFATESAFAPKLDIHSRKIGALIGLQQGAYTSLELGAECQWKKLKLKDPWTIAANAMAQYNIQNNILAYKAGGWYKLGRTDLSFGANIGYFTNFNVNRVAIGPEIGFKLVGFHVYTGGNFQLHDAPLKTINTFYVGARYFFVNDRKIKMDRDRKKKGTDRSKRK